VLQPLCKGLGRHLQDHRFVERELASADFSLENKVNLCSVGGLYVTAPLQHSHTSLNKEETTRIHPPLSITVISFVYLTYIVVYFAYYILSYRFAHLVAYQANLLYFQALNLKCIKNYQPAIHPLYSTISILTTVGLLFA
jgi:hypothetical protein